MSNAPIVLTLDCDMYSNDPETPLKALCYIFDPNIRPNLAYVQFPQRFHRIKKNDIYASKFKRLFELNPIGLNGLRGPGYVGTGAFFCRQAFFGDPSTFIAPEIVELSSNHVVEEPIKSPSILSLAHRVAGCNYENQTKWGSEPNTIYLCGCINQPLDTLNQNKRWGIGLFEVAFSKYSPLTFGIRSMGLMGLGYSHSAFWPSLSIPITVYGFLPQLALLNGVTIFPKIIRGVGDMQGQFLQMLLSGFVVVNCWPIYEAIVLRTDKGKLPAKVTVIAAFLAWALYYTATSLIF
ncbi:hypothetical protein QYF36_026697 [Acer negundo]|nr:hypothetical protein QYF36_026697 [Acer negundo]